MPMQLPNRTLLQMLLGSCDVVTSREVIVDLFADPSTRIDSRFGVTETPLQVWDGAGVGALFAQVGWVGDVDLAVGSTCYAWLVLLSVRCGNAAVPRIGAPLPLPSTGWP